MVRFRLSMAEVGGLTLAEFREFDKAYIERQKAETELDWHAMLNVQANINRKKGQPFIQLFEDKESKSKDELLAERFELFGY